MKKREEKKKRQCSKGVKKKLVMVRTLPQLSRRHNRRGLRSNGGLMAPIQEHGTSPYNPTYSTAGERHTKQAPYIMWEVRGAREQPVHSQRWMFV